MSVSWTPALLLGHPQVDGEHEELFRRTAQLVHACESGAEQEEIVRLFDYLDAYAATHFRREEQLMRELGYPELPAHRLEHDYFTNACRRLRSRLAAGGLVGEVAALVKGFLVDWLWGHVTTSDRRIFDGSPG